MTDLETAIMIKNMARETVRRMCATVKNAGVQIDTIHSDLKTVRIRGKLIGFVWLNGRNLLVDDNYPELEGHPHIVDSPASLFRNSRPAALYKKLTGKDPMTDRS
jgi:hypothetical protein